MTMKLPILEQAKQGDAKAIASLINHHLQVKGITAKVKLKGNCLFLMLESNQVQNQKAMVQFIQQGMRKLEAKSIHSVKIYGKQTDRDFPTWSQNLDLDYQPQPLPQHPTPDEPTQNVRTYPSNLSDSVLVAPAISPSTDAIQESSQSFKAIPPKIRAPKRISQLLIGSLWFRIGFNSLFVIYALFWATSYYIYDLLDVADATGFLAYLLGRLVFAIDSLWVPLEDIGSLIVLFTIIILFIWLHRVHAYLRSTEPNYPITPWGAVARFVIPFYSLWGIWNTLNTLATRLKSQGGKLARLGVSLNRCIPWLYLALISSNLLHRIYSWFVVRTIDQENGSPWFFLVHNSAYLFLSIVWLQIARIISQAIAEKAKSNPILSLADKCSEDERLVNPPQDAGINAVNTPKRLSLKAILFGVAFDLIGTSLVSLFIGIIASIVLLIRGIRLAELETVLYNSIPLLVASLTLSLILTILGGFLTAHLAQAWEIEHAFLMGAFVIIIGFIFLLLQLQLPGWYSTTSLILTIPAAVMGGYCQRNSRKR